MMALVVDTRQQPSYSILSIDCCAASVRFACALAKSPLRELIRVHENVVPGIGSVSLTRHPA